ASASEPVPALQKWVSCLAPDTEPLAVLASALMLLPSHTASRSPEEDAVQVLAQGRNIVAWWLGHMRGRAGVELPGLEVAWSSGLLTMLSSMPDSLPLSRADEALNQLLILQTDYEPNCSISTARLVARSGAGL